jgi:hypothetical protein
MKRLKRAAIAAAGLLALAGSVLVAPASTALADSVPNESFGAAAIGSQDLAPVAPATPDSPPGVASNANLAGLLATGTIQDRATDSGATSQVFQGIRLTLPSGGSLSADGLRSWCLNRGDGAIGSANIYNGAILQIGQSTIPLPVNPPPDDAIKLADGAGTVILNAQFADGPIHYVAAVYAELPGQLVELAVSACGFVDD